MTENPSQTVRSPADVSGRPAGNAPAAPVKITEVLRALLFGRWHWAVLLGLVLGLAGAWTAYRNVTPEFQSSGILEIKPTLQRVLYATEYSEALPMFSAFVDAQVELMRSPRVIAMALEDPAWTAVNPASIDDARVEFAERLSVANPSRSQLIAVSYLDADPSVALAGARAVLNSYMQIYGERDSEDDRRRLSLLEERRTSLANQANEARERIRTVADEYGTDSLASLHEARLGEQQRLGGALSALELELSAARAQSGSGPGGADGGLADPIMDELSDFLRQTERDRSLLVAQYGENHQLVKKKATQMLAIEGVIEQRRAEVETFESAEDGEAVPLTPAGFKVAQLERQHEELENMHAVAVADALEIGRKKLQLDALRFQSEEMKDRLKETKVRLDQLNLEAAGSGRIEIISQPELPLRPTDASRRKKMTAAGGLGGMAAGVGLVLLVGFLDPRVRSTLQMKHDGVELPVLGCLPDMKRYTQPDIRKMAQQVASRTIHGIRNQVTASETTGGIALAVTSASASSGKTTVSLALGKSFARSGKSVLMIDSDFRAKRLTTLCERLHPAADEPGIQQPGLSTAIEHGDAGLYSRSSTWENLDLLPADAEERVAARITTDQFRRLIRSAKEKYEIVIFDTGPMPGTIQSSAIATAVDAVVLVVSRGDHRALVDGAVDALARADGALLGVVFNRADLRQSLNLSISAPVSRTMSQSVSNRNSAETLEEGQVTVDALLGEDE